MTWNYRVIKFIDEDGEPHHQIHEVYYDKDGHPNGHTENPVSVFSNEGIDGLSSVLEKMAEALKKPALEESDFAASVQSSEVTPVGGNVFLDLGFPVPEAATLKLESNEIIIKKLKPKNWDRHKLPRKFLKNILHSIRELKTGMVTPIARHEKNQTREPGAMKGLISIAADFDAPLTNSTHVQNVPNVGSEADFNRNMMTVGSLINSLLKLPKSLPVLVQGYETGWDAVMSIDVCEMVKNAEIEDWDGEFNVIREKEIEKSFNAALIKGPRIR